MRYPPASCKSARVKLKSSQVSFSLTEKWLRQGQLFGHRIDWDEVGVLRGQRYHPSTNVPQAPPPPPPRNTKLLESSRKCFGFPTFFGGHRRAESKALALFFFFHLQTKARISISVLLNKRLRLARSIFYVCHCKVVWFKSYYDIHSRTM